MYIQEAHKIVLRFFFDLTILLFFFFSFFLIFFFFNFYFLAWIHKTIHSTLDDGISPGYADYYLQKS